MFLIVFNLSEALSVCISATTQEIAAKKTSSKNNGLA